MGYGPGDRSLPGPFSLEARRFKLAVSPAVFGVIRREDRSEGALCLRLGSSVIPRLPERLHRLTLPCMSTLTATIAVQDDAAGVIAALLRQFPKGSRVKLAISQDDEPASSLAGLEESQRMVKEAREQAPACPWTTTAEAMKALREGEND